MYRKSENPVDKYDRETGYEWLKRKLKERKAKQPALESKLGKGGDLKKSKKSKDQKALEAYHRYYQSKTKGKK